jgi:hypothetical protein
VRFLAVLAVLFLIRIGTVVASECHNSSVTDAQLPPVAYRHEPSMPYFVMSAELMNTLRGSRKGQVVGYYFPHSGKIAICAGLTGKALRIIRMHEEAHAAGWRHG